MLSSRSAPATERDADEGELAFLQTAGAFSAPERPQQHLHHSGCGEERPATPPLPEDHDADGEQRPPSTPKRPRAPVAFDIYRDRAADADEPGAERHCNHHTPPWNSASAAESDDEPESEPDDGLDADDHAHERRSPPVCTFAYPLVTATCLVLISPAKLGRRPTPKLGVSKQRRILQNIRSGNSSRFFKRGAGESFGSDEENMCGGAFRPSKELRWSMQSSTPCSTDAQQPYREAAQAEAELLGAAVAAAEASAADWPV
jgi:hypothetical protein